LLAVSTVQQAILSDLKVTRRGYFASGQNDATSARFGCGGIKLILR
jgi:hypothetical protein